MGLALDEPKDDDKTFTVQEISFLVEKSLLESTGGVKVDFADAGPKSGFTIASTNPMGSGGCSSGSCSSGSCG
ncbi:MAG: hypothetical protein OCC45_07725 [Desulfotalea sp.]